MGGSGSFKWVVDDSKDIKLKMCPYTRSRLLPIPNGHQSFKARPASADTRRGLFKLFCSKHLNTWIFQKSSIKWETAIMHFSHLPIGKMASVTAPNMKGIYFVMQWSDKCLAAKLLASQADVLRVRHAFLTHKRLLNRAVKNVDQSQCTLDLDKFRARLSSRKDQKGLERWIPYTFNSHAFVLETLTEKITSEV